jgi:hypothetical protein
MNDPKPGWQTTEFWTHIFAFVVTALVTLHYVPPADQQGVTAWASATAVGVVGLAGNLMLAFHYIQSRIDAKKAAAAAQTAASADDRTLAKNSQVLAAIKAAAALKPADPAPDPTCPPDCTVCNPPDLAK